ncbi:SURF1 family cytochrome oxidase biogenesis protein [Arsenicicoccus sp. oral taxon 190]|uniref:SURF1 family cytochrome oxidase biogenesis protein n=1 Tax=Arsenicicoccus sp. oral taxon 190 TaxID=1658671 RepID=UPI00067B2558|nr:SURF1 family protein [Arsenicicoccus sp. oral taxon 190]
MIRTLLQPRWLKLLAAAFVFLLACIWLGQWQLGRYEHKQAKVHAIDRNYSAAPAPLRTLLPTPQTGVSDATLWRQVTMTGTYDGSAPLLVRNRPRDGRRGYEVVWPLRLPDGTAILVDRGWLSAGEGAAAQLPTVPPAPKGQVQVTGWLRWGETDLAKSPARGQLASINYTIAQEQVDAPLNHAYVVLGSEGAVTAGDASTGLAAPPGPDRDEGWNNVSYFGQWWLFGLVAIGMVVYAARREHLEGAAAAAGPGGESDGAHSAHSAHSAGSARSGRSVGSTRSARPKKPKKVRIWDEEDE